MGKTRPGRRQIYVLHLEPKRAAATIGYAFLALLALAVAAVALLYQTSYFKDSWKGGTDFSPKTSAIVAAAVGALALLFILGSIVNGRRWHIGRVIERLSEDPTVAPLLPPVESLPSPQRAAMIPPLRFAIERARKLPRPHAKPRRISAAANISGHRPLRIAYLRIFENQPRVRTFVQGAWREFGYVALLRSATSVTPAEYKWAKQTRRFPDLFISTQQQLEGSLMSQKVLSKGTYRLKAIGPTTIRVRDRYGSYGVQSLLCHGAFWKNAVDVLLERVDVVALDLSGFVPANAGTHYELQRVVDRFPIERVVFLIDPRSQQQFIAEQIQLAWSQMAAGSPNSTSPRVRVANIVVTDRFAVRSTTSTTTTPGAGGQMHTQTQTTQVQVRLEASRRETRRAAAMAQENLDAWSASHPAGGFPPPAVR